MTASQTPPTDLTALDQMTGGAFSAATSGERAARLRDWLQGEPAPERLHEVFREMSARDKGAARVLKERLDELKRAKEQDSLISGWADKAQQLLAAPRINIADALAWQRDAAKAGAPLSREPLAGLKQRLMEVVRRVEELQHQVMVMRESAVLLAQRIEVLSTKGLDEVQAAQAQLEADVQAWQAQAQAMATDALWSSVDMRHPPQLEAARGQLSVVYEAFVAALTQARQALDSAEASLPPVPVWAEEIRRHRGAPALQAPVPSAGAAAEGSPGPKAEAKPDAAQRQLLRQQATEAVRVVLEAVEKEVAEGHGKASAGAAAALRQVLKTHGRHLDPALDARVHQALTAAGELEGWQRWRSDQIRQDLLTRAQALLGPDKQPTLGGRKMQEALRQLREAWKQTDQGGLPNHSLWKKFDTACNEAYKTVQTWLAQLKEETAAQRAARQQLIDEVRAWTEAHAQDSDWRAQARAVHQFAERWRNAGHLSEKAYAELQPQWKATIHAAAQRLEAEQKLSLQRRHALIDEARQLAQGNAWRIDAVKALQQRWQQEAQAVPLDRKTEQKLWETFRQPIDEAFARKPATRGDRSAHADRVPLSPHDQAVLQAAQALEQANGSGDAARIRAALAALEQLLSSPPAAAAVPAASAAPSESAPESEGSSAAEGQAAAPESAAAAPAAPTPPAPRRVVAVRGDDRPGQKRVEPASADRAGRRPDRAGPRGSERGDARGMGRPERDRERSGPRLADPAFRAQREAREQAELTLRKLASLAHGESLTRLLSAWKERATDQLPSLQELGKGLSASARQAWAQALGAPVQPADRALQALLRLEVAAEAPTPAEHLPARRALQLQLLTRRHEAGPEQTWAADVAQVLACAHDEAAARRLQTVLRQLLRR